MTEECSICHRPAPRLYHRLVETENGVAHYVCWRDRGKAMRRREEYASTDK
ncbi:hypothetical protein HSR121_2004 [Halapricum desulfuricans]|uniref:Uncharacterized protein n=1 Tax=Halapricum desulfuricans TaxID=2841257 RepID=A0A897N0V8_9EURY|nr:hypothetical protein HSR121_2004 [Halapricum desulfuricans]